MYSFGMIFNDFIYYYPSVVLNMDLFFPLIYNTKHNIKAVFQITRYYYTKCASNQRLCKALRDCCAVV